MMIRRIHNTSEGMLDLQKRYPLPDFNYSKPIGLWYGIGNSWLEWCDSEQLDWTERYCFELQVDMSKILVIKSFQELQSFIDRYEVEDRYGWGIIKKIDWKVVSQDYTGIEIRNYHKYKWSVDRGHSWFLGWDVDSGCIWDLSAVNSASRFETNSIQI